MHHEYGDARGSLCISSLVVDIVRLQASTFECFVSFIKVLCMLQL